MESHPFSARPCATPNWLARQTNLFFKHRDQVLDILLIDDEPDLRELLCENLREIGYRVQTAADGEEGMGHLVRHVFDVVICDVRLPRLDGLSLLRHIRKETPSTEVILMTAYADVAQAVSALKEGAYDYLTKPFDIDELLLQTGRIAETRLLRRELETARGELTDRKIPLIGESPAIKRILKLTTMVSQSDAPVLIRGESGTGKEVVARLIHGGSARRERPFVAVNCGALVENLVEAELFGHERGAFTGAVKRRDGRFKAADGGVLFLDEIAELPPAAQAKLLRVLQEGTFEPLGSNTPLRVDVRIISATHRNLAERVKAGLFREDLFYRVNVIEVFLPPLRERPGDLPLLLRHFVERLTPHGAAPPTITPAAWATLMQYPFPGNVRELSHAVEHALVLSGGKEIDTRHLPPAMLVSAPSAECGSGLGYEGPVRPLHVALREFEQEYLQRALKAADGKRAKAAALLGISRKTLWDKLRDRDLTATGEPADAEDLLDASARRLPHG
jgi:two-component system, NtrC family, response regulator AtoC